jgi:hypothetical protein
MMYAKTAIYQLVGLASIANAQRMGGLFDKWLGNKKPVFEPSRMHFNRISTFVVCTNIDPTCNVNNETSSEIVVASKDGNTLYYSDGPWGVLGVVDITDPFNPLPAGTVDMGGDPTSTATVNDWILVAVTTSPNFTNPSGTLQVVDPETLEIVRTFDLGGQVSVVYFMC